MLACFAMHGMGGWSRRECIYQMKRGGGVACLLACSLARSLYGSWLCSDGAGNGMEWNGMEKLHRSLARLYLISGLTLQLACHLTFAAIE